MVTKSTILGTGVGIISFIVIGGATPFGMPVMIAGAITTAAATRYIASRYIFHEQRAREEARKGVEHFKNRLRTVKNVRELEVLMDNIVSSGMQTDLKEDIRDAIDRVKSIVRTKFTGAELSDRLKRLDALEKIFKD